MASALPPTVALPVADCADGVDNDGDGGTDWLGTAAGAFEDWDQECTWPGDPSEQIQWWNCHHPQPHVHTYGPDRGVGKEARVVVEAGPVGVAVVVVYDTNLRDCDGDGLPGDFDGDYDSGSGGTFFGFGPWANEPTCNYGYQSHGATVTVEDTFHGRSARFYIAADDTSGPFVEVDPVDGSTSCSTDGSITPGDPSTDPGADPDDCFAGPFQGTGSTCGAGGDGGYWVIMESSGLRGTAWA